MPHLPIRIAPSRLGAAALALSAALLAGSVALPAASASTTPTTTPTTVDAGGAGDGDNPQLGAAYNAALAEEAKLQQALDQAQAESLAASARLLQLQQQTAATQLRLLGAQAEEQRARRTAQVREAARRRAERRTRRALGRLRQQAVASYVRGGQTSLLEAILSARSGQEASQALSYGDAALGDSKDLLATLERARDARRRAAAAARAASAKAASTRDQVAAATRFLTTARDRQRQLVDLIDLKVAAVNSTLLDVQTKALLAQGEAAGNGGTGGSIGAMLAALEAKQPAYRIGAVALSSPVPGAKVSSKFGIRFHPILHVYRLHAGCDLGVPVGTPIRAAADGTVVLASTTGGYGNTTVIDHGNSLATLYGHQSQIVVAVGQVVHRGDVIGYSGNTGLSTGPHLHFETRIKGVPVNPEGIVTFS